jgi:pyrroline-5-carboxylate reductase
MASALARGWGEPAVVADVDGAKAESLAGQIGGTVAESNAAVAEAADVVVLCHKPAQLEDVAAEIRDSAKAIVSVLGGVPVATVEEAYPGKPVYRFMPNQAAEVRRGVSCYVPGTHAAAGPEREVVELFERVGSVMTMPDDQMDAATAIMSCAPAWIALVAEALVDAGSRHGVGAEEAARLVAETVAGTGELLAGAGLAPAEVRRRVTSPGGLTERGTRVLEEAGVRDAFDAAVDVVVNP